MWRAVLSTVERESMKQALVAVMVALSLLQSVRAQEETEENQSTNSEWRDAHVSIIAHVCVIHTLYTCLHSPGCGNQPTVLNVDHYLLQLNSKLDTLALSLETLKSKLEVLDTNLLEHKQDTAAELAQLQATLTNTQSSLATHTQQVNSKLSFLTTSLSEHEQQTAAELAQLQTSLTSTYSKLESLNTSLSEHKEGTAAELAILQTSLTATESSLTTSIWQSYNLLDSGITSTQSSVEAANSKLDTIVTTPVQLTSNHQELHTGISELDCVDTEELHQNLQNNLTGQLEGTQDWSTGTGSGVQGPYTCGGTTGWRRVVYWDMTDPSTTCPSGWQLTGYSKRTCGRASTGSRTCDSVTFLVSGGEYSRVCGRIKAYQAGSYSSTVPKLALMVPIFLVSASPMGTHENTSGHLLQEYQSICITQESLTVLAVSITLNTGILEFPHSLGMTTSVNLG